MTFTPQELADIRKADRQIEKEFSITREEWAEGTKRDRESRELKMTNKAVWERAYYWRNREKILERKRDQGKAYYQRNKEAKKAYAAVYYHEHREECMVQRKTYRDATADERNAKRRERYRQNPEAVLARNRAWRAAHKDEVNARARERRKAMKEIEEVLG